MCLWGAVAYIIVRVEPNLIKDIWIPGLYLPFFVIVSVALWYTIALFVHSFWQSLLLTMTIVLSLILSTLQLMFWGLALVLLLTLVIESWYIYSNHEKNRTKHEPKDRGTGI